ncbi:MAG: hypothetical protein D6705_10215 [Deltaproteobacteria bacterium]|nr:MAG: hypothetical protein D6705_10215 [Deltaproteobacteria bacterium]
MDEGEEAPAHGPSRRDPAIRRYRDLRRPSPAASTENVGPARAGPVVDPVPAVVEPLPIAVERVAAVDTLPPPVGAVEPVPVPPVPLAVPPPPAWVNPVASGIWEPYAPRDTNATKAM